MAVKPLATIVEAYAGIDVRPALDPKVEKGRKVVFQEWAEAEVHGPSSGLRRASVNRAFQAADFCPFAGWPGAGSGAKIGSRMVVRSTATGSGLEKR